MRKFLISLLLILITVSVIAKEKEEIISTYKDNYFLFGNNQDQVKFQLSVKYNLIYPSETGLYLGFTMIDHWMVYNGKDTMYQGYMPEVFYRLESGKNLFNNLVIPYIDYFQCSPFNHHSTGVEGPLHRSMNMYYGQVQASIGDVYNFGVNVKVLGYYDISDMNPDINKYRKNYEADVFFKLKSRTVQFLDKEEFHCTVSGNPLGNGFYQLEAKVRIITSVIQPKFCIQYFSGYTQFFQTYNQKDESLRLGLVFDI